MMIAAISELVGIFLFQTQFIQFISFLFLKKENVEDTILIPTYHARVVNDFDMCSTQVLQQISQSTITRSIQQEYAVSTFDTE